MMERRNKIILVIEAFVGVLILAGGIFIAAYESHAPTVTPTTPELSTYISEPLQISLKYPYGWQIDPAFNGIRGIERYQGPDGFFRVDATNDSTRRKNTWIKKYSTPIMLGETKYRYFLLEADPAHLASISASVEFFNAPTPKP